MGVAFESIAIGILLKQHDGKVNVIVDGLAGSWASVVVTADEKIIMFPKLLIMNHKAWTITLGNADEFGKTVDDLYKIDSAVKAIYKSRFVGTYEVVKDLMAEESLLTARSVLLLFFMMK